MIHSSKQSAARKSGPGRGARANLHGMGVTVARNHAFSRDEIEVDCGIVSMLTEIELSRGSTVASRARAEYGQPIVPSGPRVLRTKDL
jgi:hypothetical protein